mgnify:FL=1
MARQNKSLGKFKLHGIRRAPRGVPQIEVTFAIDANGIVNVSAKDLDTGKRQEITIQGSGNLSREEVERCIKEAQRYAEDDARARTEVQAAEHLETLMYRSQEIRKKADKEQKKRLDELVKKGKDALKHKDSQQIKEIACELEKFLNEAGRA